MEATVASRADLWFVNTVKKKVLSATHLMMKSAATFRTLGHRIKATIVRRFPKMPVSMMMIVAVAASVNSGRENLLGRDQFEIAGA